MEDDDGAETDEARDAADEAEIADLEDDDSEVELSPEEAQAGRQALEKASSLKAFVGCCCPGSPWANYLHQIIKLSSKVFTSPHARSELAKLAKENKLKSETLLRPVRTRWNTVTIVIGRATGMKSTIGALCDMHQFNKDSKGLRLRRFILSDDEWTILSDLHRLLDVSLPCFFSGLPLSDFLAAFPLRN